MGLRHNGSDTEPLEMILDSLYSIFYIKRTCIWGADGTNPKQGNLAPPVLSEVFSSLWNKHLVSVANLVIVHAEQYRCERQLSASVPSQDFVSSTPHENGEGLK
jgi:hypothetical protein